MTNTTDKATPPADQTILFMFRLWVDDQEQLLSFMHTNKWNRGVVIFQLARLFPEAKTFKLFDGVVEFIWDNTEEDILSIIDKLNHPEKYVVDKADETE